MADPWGYDALANTISHTANTVSSRFLRLGQIAQQQAILAEREKHNRIDVGLKAAHAAQQGMSSPSETIRRLSTETAYNAYKYIQKDMGIPDNFFERFKDKDGSWRDIGKEFKAPIKEINTILEQSFAGKIDRQQRDLALNMAYANIEGMENRKAAEASAINSIKNFDEGKGISAVADYTIPTMPQAAPVNANPGLTDIAQPQQGWQDSENVPAIQPESTPQGAPAEGGEIGLAPQVPTVQTVTPPPAMTVDIPQVQTPQYPSREQLTAMGGSPSTRPFFEKIAERVLDQKMPKAEKPTEKISTLKSLIDMGLEQKEALERSGLKAEETVPIKIGGTTVKISAKDAFDHFTKEQGMVELNLGTAEKPIPVKLAAKDYLQYVKDKDVPLTGDMKEFGARKFGSAIETSQGRNAMLDYMSSPEGTKAWNDYKREQKQNLVIQQPLSPAQELSAVHGVRTEIGRNPIIKDFNDISGRYNMMKEAMAEAQKTNNFVAVDQTLINMFNKMMDPQSVVRESEYARTPQNLSVLSRIKGQAQKILEGGAGLAADDRKALMTMAERYYKVTESRYDAKVKDYEDLAKKSKLDPEMVIGPYRRKNIQARTIVRSGTFNGKKVIQYSDGSTEYAD